MKLVNLIASLLLVIGGINWGLIGLFDFNLVTQLFGDSVISQAVYGLVGLSAIYYIVQGKLLDD